MKRFLSVLLLLCIIMASIFVSSCDGDESAEPTATTDASTNATEATTTTASTTTAATTGKSEVQEAPAGTFCSHEWDSGKSESFSCGTKLTHTCSLCKATKAEISATGNTEHSFGSNNLCTTCGIDKVTVNGVSLSKFVIVYANDTYSKNLATAIKNKFNVIKGYKLTQKPASEGENEYEIIVGDAKREASKVFFANNEAYLSKNYEITVSGNKIYVNVGSEEMVETAKKHFFKLFLNDKKILSLTDESSFKGDNLNVYSRLNNSDIRIASNNVYYYGTPSERKPTLLKSFESFDADILMLQEMRDTWHNLIDSDLQKMGYTAVPTNSNKTPNVAAKDNFTPIWYRDSVVELIDYGYEQFESVAMYNPDDYLCTSKSYTWALFKDRSTGRRFVCISTHLTYGSNSPLATPNELRVSDANEIKNLVEDIKALYGDNILAVVMGDFNCKQNEEPYLLLDNVMTNVRLSNDVKIKNNTEYGTAGHKIGEMPYQEWGYIIDHAFVSGADFTINQYQHVINEYSLNASDHIPLLIDIEFTK